MAGMMDDTTDKMSDTGDRMKDRFHELKSKEEKGELDDRGRAELQQLRTRFEGKDT